MSLQLNVMVEWGKRGWFLTEGLYFLTEERGQVTDWEWWQWRWVS